MLRANRYLVGLRHKYNGQRLGMMWLVKPKPVKAQGRGAQPEMAEVSLSEPRVTGHLSQPNRQSVGPGGNDKNGIKPDLRQAFSCYGFEN